MRNEHEPCSDPRQSLAPAAVVLATVDEVRVGAERDVVEEHAVVRPSDVDPPLGSGVGVECADRVITVEPDIAGEVVPGAERDAHERQVPLDRDRRDRRERAVPAGDPELLRIGAPRKLDRIVALSQNACDDPAPPRGIDELLDCRPGRPRAGIYEQEAGHWDDGAYGSRRTAS